MSATRSSHGFSWNRSSAQAQNLPRSTSWSRTVWKSRFRISSTLVAQLHLRSPRISSRTGPAVAVPAIQAAKALKSARQNGPAARFRPVAVAHATSTNDCFPANAALRAALRTPRRCPDFGECAGVPKERCSFIGRTVQPTRRRLAANQAAAAVMKSATSSSACCASGIGAAIQT